MCLFAVGTIPANTGRIGAQCARHMEAQDHPREYGENEHRISGFLERDGPSPRIRGEYGLKIPLSKQ